MGSDEAGPRQENRPATNTPNAASVPPASGGADGFTAEQTRALEVARALVKAGVPVFVAWPDSTKDSGYRVPRGWETSTPTLDVVDRWRPGWALCAVMGHVVDLIDVDPRHGGDASAAGWKEAGMWPRSYGQAATPSGGTHDFVARLRVRSRDHVVPGIDIKAGLDDGQGRGFAFIAPTVRVSKTTGLSEPYRWLVEPDLDALAEGDDDTGAAVAELVTAAKAKPTSAGTLTGNELLMREPPHVGPIPGGSRHRTLVSYAGRLRNLPISFDEACSLMLARWRDCAQPPDARDPLTEGEALAKLRDVWDRYPAEDGAEPAGEEAEHATQTGEGDGGFGSWKPVDLAPYLDGTVKPAEPSVGLARSDGVRLLYPGKEHAVIGEMEAGKSWFCLASVKVELTAGRPVVYIHFEECDPTDTLSRLLALDVPERVIRDRFRFVGPERRVSAEALAGLLDPPPSLVVFDGVNEAMALHGWGIREEDGAAAFRRHLVKPCTAVGAATLAADHVVKDAERRGRTALGSIHKVNGLSGALILLENAEPFGRGARGRSHVSVLKDRPGYLRRHGAAADRTPGKVHLGELTVDDTPNRPYPGLELGFWKPRPQTEPAPGAPGTPTVDDEVLAAVKAVIATGVPPTLRSVRDEAGVGKDKVDAALARLVASGRLVESTGVRRARVFTVAEDQLIKDQANPS